MAERMARQQRERQEDGPSNMFEQASGLFGVIKYHMCTCAAERARAATLTWRILPLAVTLTWWILPRGADLLRERQEGGERQAA
eukprot:82063-Prorocentrum_minimum.AAC.1